MNMHTKPFTVEFLGTPEAGKTTVIKRIEKDLSESINVKTIRESAEIVPNYFPKASIDAHFWMRLKTAQTLLEATLSSEKNDLILVDRGIVDTVFWDYYYGRTGKLTKEQVSHANTFFTDLNLVPDFIVFLSTTPEESIRRRGGEGRIVTINFVKDFNNALNSFMEQIPQPIYHLDTTCMSKDDVFDAVYEKIITNYNNAK